MTQKPSQGRIVLVPMDPNFNNGAKTAPAMVTQVFGDTELPDGSYTVNVRIFRDATTADEIRTSISLYETAEAARAAKGDETRHIGWWPPRV